MMTAFFENLYREYNRPEYIDPDPLLLVKRYPDPRDQEIAGFIAANFALGRVQSILDFLSGIFRSFSSPRDDILSGEGMKRWEKNGPGYYRFYKKEEIKRFLLEISRILKEFGSLQALFLQGYRREFLVSDGLESLIAPFRSKGITVTANPSGQSACKRLHLFLRWMVRRDNIDTGVWNNVDAGHLMYPVDTHILQTTRGLGITQRRQADKRASEEITGFFRAICPSDPVKYDFCLSRFGIHPELDYTMLYSSGTEHNRIA